VLALSRADQLDVPDQRLRVGLSMALNVGVGIGRRTGVIFLVQGALYVQAVQPPDRITVVTWTWMLIRGAFRSLVLTAWIVVYGLVGTQLSYTLRPFFGVPLGGHDFWSDMGSLITSLVRTGQ
jgi:hypothetical protein